MENFTVYNPTCLYFGRNVVNNLNLSLTQIGAKNILLIYGKGSIKQNGVYDDVIQQCKIAKVSVTEYSGIKPNPVVDDVEKAAETGRKNNIDAVIAVGGGSVIDSAKIVSLCIKESHNPWDIMKSRAKAKSAVPVIAILTLAATGTEMNPFAVLQNSETQEKIGFGNLLMFPKYSFLDPHYTCSVPANHTAYGIVDLIAHTLEAFFGRGEAALSDRFVFSIINEAIEKAPLLLTDLTNYKYRSDIMWDATCALNGITGYGRSSSDWGVHDIGHTLSFLYDLPHGATLSIAYPAWMKLQKEKLNERISFLGKNIFGVSNPDDTIIHFENFFKSINSPVKLIEANITSDKKNEIQNLMIKNKVSGYVHKLSVQDYDQLIDLMN